MAIFLPLLAVGAVLGGFRIETKAQGIAFSLVGLGALYFLARASLSPVPELARRDLFLVGAGFMAFMSALSGLRSPSGRGLLVGFLTIVVLGNVLVGAYQLLGNHDFRFLREVSLQTKERQLHMATGFFYHPSSLSGLLQIALPVYISLAILAENRAAKMLGWVLTFLSAGLCFLSYSRGGAAAMVAGGIVSAIFAWKIRNRGLRSPQTFSRKRQLLIGASVVGFVIIGVVLYFMVGNVLEMRGGEQSVEGSLRGRLGMYGIALNVWLSHLWVGAGGQSYSYFFTRDFYGIPVWYGDAEMAHSEFLQVLCDYGLLGFLVVLMLLIFFGYYFAKGSQDLLEDARKTQKGSWDLRPFWLLTAAMGALMSCTLRAFIDFQLYIAPNLILFALLMAGGVVALSPAVVPREGDAAGQSRPIGRRLLEGVALVLVAAVSFFVVHAGWREVKAFPDWLAVQQADSRAEKAEKLRSYGKKAPSIAVWRAVARNSLENALTSEAEQPEALQLAASDWETLVTLHPLDGEALTNYARCLDDLSRFDEAGPLHLRALEAAGRRENYFGVVFGVGAHLAKKADYLLRERKTEEGLYLCLEAEQAFEESMNLGFKGRENRKWLTSLEQRIQFLQSARIEPKEVPVLPWKEYLPESY